MDSYFGYIHNEEYSVNVQAFWNLWAVSDARI